MDDSNQVMIEKAHEGFRLSPQQERLLRFLQTGDERAYRAECSVRIEGDIDAKVLLEALGYVVSRHEILRATFLRESSGRAVQVIVPRQESIFRIAELTGLAPGEQIEAVEELWNGELAARFDLERGPVLRALLVTLEPGRRILRLALPGLCADAVGLENLVADLAHSATPGSRRHADPEPVQYTDVAAVLNDLLESEETRRGRKFWDRLGLRVLDHPGLPYERQQKATEGFAPAAVSARFTAIVPALDALAVEVGVPLEAVLLTGWLVLLSRLTATAALTVGVASDGRSHQDLSEAVGLLARFLPVQVRLQAGEPFREVARSVALALHDSRTWQDFFTWENEGEAGGIPLYLPFAFELLKPAAVREAAGRRFTIESRAVCVERFDVLLAMERDETGLATELRFDSALRDRAGATRILEHLEVLLSDVAARGPGVAVDALEILSVAERKQLLSFEPGGYVNDLCLHQRFERQVEQSPDAVAVERADGSGAITYRELNGRANQIARFLERLDESPERPVAVCGERSGEVVAAVLGVLKAGLAYIPLDPSYPEARLGSMLGDSGASVVLTLGEPQIVVRDGAVRRVPLEDGRCPADAESTENLATAASDPRALAYMIYTSGSTGQPKGVMVSHRAICNRLLWMQEAFPLSADDRVLQKTSLSFDASLWEIFSPLLAGARVVLARPGGQQDAAYLVRAIAERRITVLQLVPSFLRVFLEEPGLEGLTSLRRLFSGGEVLPVQIAERCRQRLGATALCNLYGPTESAIDATFNPDVPGGGQGATVPIGRPISNVQVYLLDPLQRLAPVGLPGELHIGGDSLAWGYHRRPDLTAERFIPDPFSGQPGRRLYRTGDLARHLVTGEIEYLGRTDHQVKLRGYRIELGEIEAVLRRCPGVGDAAVTVWGEGEDARLIAYFVPVAEQSPGGDSLRRDLEKRLPPYMVPAVYVELPQFPVTPNGKLDRGALPSPSRAAARHDAGTVSFTLVEELLTGIWCGVLGVESIGLDDDFFESGGHSLLAMRVIARTREAFYVEVEVRDLFEEPTIAGLGQRIERLIRAGEGVEAPPIVRVSRDRALPLSFSQQRLWFLDKLKPGSAAYNLPSAIRLQGSFDAGALRLALAEMVRRHEALRTTFQDSGGEPQQVIAATADPGLLVVDLRGLPAGEREALELARREADQPFRLGRDPLLRVRLVRLGDEDHVVLVTMHHIVSDGWSMGIFIDETMALYAAFHKGERSLLEELPIQYADYAVWQRSWLQGDALESELSYWRRQLAGAPPVLELPLDFPRPKEQTFTGADYPFYFPPDLSAAVRRLARQQGASVFMVLLAAFDLLLARATGQDDVVLGTPIANRTHRETEGLIGFFVNTLVLRTDLSGGPPFRELLARVRRMTLEAFAHQDVPFERLVEDLRPERDLAHTPIFQVVFALQNTPAGNLDLPGLSSVPFEREVRVAKFDLTLILTDTGEILQGSLEYNTDLFARASIERMAGHLGRLLRAVTSDPEILVTVVSLLSEAEYHQVLREWNDSAAPRTERLAHQWVDAQARRAPEAIAMACGEERWTYGELNGRANRLAWHLHELGVGPGSVVAVFFERSFELVQAALAVLKAGAAYLPLDPGYPRERLGFMLADSAAAYVMTRRDLAESLPGDLARPVLVDSEQLAGERDSAPDSGAGPEDLAYVIYTSGSTGRPKGTEVHHGGVANLIAWNFGAYGVTPADRTAMLSNVGFDASVWEIWPQLAAGASVWIPEQELLASPVDLLGWMTEKAITLTFLSTPLATVVLDEPLPVGLALRYLLTGGDRLTRWRPAEACFELINHYGPTECAVLSTGAAIPAVADRELTPSIGRPLSNVDIYLLDPALRPVPIGVQGELYIGGFGVGRGYLRRPGMTAGVFVPDPWSERPGARLYRTGDLARYRADGKIEFLGRTDHQVKLRGFRIEMGEIEAVLASCPGVRDAVAQVWEDPSIPAGRPAARRLVAYVAGGGELSVQALRDHLKSRVPEYMLPAAFVILPALPLTSNGKVDRRALPGPEPGPSHLEDVYVAPRNPVEELVAEIWAEVLGFERVGIHDDFFDLGGHSLLVMQVVLRLRESLEVEVPVREIFSAPTVAELVERLPLYETQPGQVETIAVALQKVKAMSPEELDSLLQVSSIQEGEG